MTIRYDYWSVMDQRINVKSCFRNIKTDLITIAWDIEATPSGKEICVYGFTLKSVADRHVKTIARAAASLNYEAGVKNGLERADRVPSFAHIDLTTASGYIKMDEFASDFDGVLTKNAIDKLTMWDLSIFCIQRKIRDKIGSALLAFTPTATYHYY